MYVSQDKCTALLLGNNHLGGNPVSLDTTIDDYICNLVQVHFNC